MTTVAAILKHKGYQVTTIEPTVTIAQVVDVLAEHRIGAALVIDDADQLLGIVSERDIVRCLAANGASTLTMTAGQLMTRALQLARPEKLPTLSVQLHWLMFNVWLAHSATRERFAIS